MTLNSEQIRIFAQSILPSPGLKLLSSYIRTVVPIRMSTRQNKSNAPGTATSYRYNNMLSTVLLGIIVTNNTPLSTDSLAHLSIQRVIDDYSTVLVDVVNCIVANNTPLPTLAGTSADTEDDCIVAVAAAVVVASRSKPIVNLVVKLTRNALTGYFLSLDLISIDPYHYSTPNPMANPSVAFLIVKFAPCNLQFANTQ